MSFITGTDRAPSLPAFLRLLLFYNLHASQGAFLNEPVCLFFSSAILNPKSLHILLGVAPQVLETGCKPVLLHLDFVVLVYLSGDNP